MAVHRFVFLRLLFWLLAFLFLCRGFFEDFLRIFCILFEDFFAIFLACRKSVKSFNSSPLSFCSLLSASFLFVVLFGLLVECLHRFVALLRALGYLFSLTV